MITQANLAMSMMTSRSIVTRTAVELHYAQMSRLWLCLMLAGCNEGALPSGMQRGDLAMSGVGYGLRELLELIVVQAGQSRGRRRVKLARQRTHRVIALRGSSVLGHSGGKLADG